MANQPNDLQVLPLAPHECGELLPDGVLIGKIASRVRLVYHCDRRIVGRVAFRKLASREKWRSQGFEKARPGSDEIRVILLRYYLPFRDCRFAPRRPIEWCVRRNARRYNAGHALKCIQQILRNTYAATLQVYEQNALTLESRI